MVLKPAFIKGLFICAAVIVGAAFFWHSANFSWGQELTQSELNALQREVDSKNKEIRELEALAEQYRKTIATTEEQARTLASEIKRITNTVKKLQNDIRITETKIQKTNLEIRGLQGKIGDTESGIGETRQRLGEFLRLVHQYDSEAMIEILLKNEELSGFFSRFDANLQLQESIHKSLDNLRTLKGALSLQKSTSEAKVSELKKFTETLADQKRIQQIQQQERAKVLEETRSQERRFQELLAENEKRRRELEEEILDYETKLKITIDPSSLPKGARGVLLWPIAALDKPLFQCGKTVWNFLTQCFGNTAFAKSGAYNGNGHNGIDIRGNGSTEIFASESGTVRGAGDTDAGCRGASYGKWILVDHNNGLSTLYAHLSLIKVSPGQSVARGQTIAYAGKTGYATGPHLHFTVYAKSAVEIGVLKSKVCGRNMTLPLAPLNAYLNPLDYL